MQVLLLQDVDNLGYAGDVGGGKRLPMDLAKLSAPPKISHVSYNWGFETS